MSLEMTWGLFYLCERMYLIDSQKVKILHAAGHNHSFKQSCDVLL